MITRECNIPRDNSFFLFGPRQTGKSTLIQSTFPEDSTLYYDLLKSEEYRRLSANPQLLREEVLHRRPGKQVVVIDEIQRIPDLLNEVHSLMESPHPPVFALTGSSARKLKRSHANLLAGRALSYHLFPLTAQELGAEFSLQRAMALGTLPPIYMAPSDELAAERLRAYVDTYLREEIELEAQVRQIDAFLRFLSIAGHESGNILNFSNISRETGTSYQTVKNYFQILEDTLIGQFLFPYQKSFRKRHARHPKFYFFDNGVLRALIRKLTVPLEPQTPEYGRAFEHFVILETHRISSYHRLDFALSFYSTEGGAEVDLVIETPRGNVVAVEIKSTNALQSTHLRGLRSFSEVVPKAILVCVCTTPHPTRIGKVHALPWQDYLEALRNW